MRERRSWRLGWTDGARGEEPLAQGPSRSRSPAWAQVAGDIDGFDLQVLDALLRNCTFAARVLLVEINEKIPPPLRFTVDQ